MSTVNHDGRVQEIQDILSQYYGRKQPNTWSIEKYNWSAVNFTISDVSTIEPIVNRVDLVFRNNIRFGFALEAPGKECRFANGQKHTFFVVELEAPVDEKTKGVMVLDDKDCLSCFRGASLIQQVLKRTLPAMGKTEIRRAIIDFIKAQ